MSKYAAFAFWAILPLLFLWFSPNAGTDVSWLGYLAREWLAGVDIGRDYVDVTPPLIIYYYLPAIWLGEWFGMALPKPILLQTWLLIGASGAGVMRLLQVAQAQPLMDKQGSIMLHGLLLIGLCWLPVYYQIACQREHYLMILLLPWLMAQWLGVAGLLPHHWRIILAVMGGLGVAIKPYFILLPLAVGMVYPVMAWRTERNIQAVAQAVQRHWLGWDFLPMVLVQIIYLAWLLWVEQDYVTESLPLAMATYAGFGLHPLGVLRKLVASSALLLLLVGFVKPKDEARMAQKTMHLAMLAGAALMVLVQLKGFSYHFYPFWLVALWGLALFRAEDAPRLLQPLSAYMRYFGLRVLWVGQLGFTMLMVAQGVREQFIHPDHDVNSHISRIIAKYQPKEWVYFDRIPAFAAMNRHTLRTSQVTMHPWYLTGFYDYDSPASFSRYKPDGAPLPFRRPDKMGRLERRMFDKQVRRFLQNPPELVINETLPWEQGYGFVAFDWQGYYSMDADFAEIWQRYRLVERYGDWEIWQL